MLSIYKYPIPIEDEFSLLLPTGAEILTVQVQNGEPNLWALVDPELPKVSRYFRFAGTGHPIDNGKYYLYIGTVQMHESQLVFHLFEIDSVHTSVKTQTKNSCAGDLSWV